jgi:hypothetical protein
VGARALDLVAVERLERDLDVVRADLVLLAVDADSGSAAAIAAATCGICLPKRGPSAR